MTPKLSITTNAIWLLSALVAFACASVSHAQSLEQLEQQAIRDAIERVSPAVVQLQIIGGAERVGDVNLASGPSTGVILSPDGYVVTSRYRFDPAPTTVVALLADGRQFATKTVASDFSRSLVLLKLVGAENLPTVEPAPADSYRVGQWAIALGRTYRVDRPNVSVGIVSALRRIQGRALQTDAAVSAVNYGGPLVDIQGRVLGIIAPMSPSAEGSIAGVEWYDSGIGFAVPLAEWLSSIDRLKNGENLELGYLGIELGKGIPREESPTLENVSPGGPAAVAGLQKGDRITAINGAPVATQMDLQYAIKPHYAGDTVNITFDRDKQQQSVDVSLKSIAAVSEAAKAAKSAEEQASEAPAESAE